jgi:hypothetical protein
MGNRIRRLGLSVLLFVISTGCVQQIPKEALQLSPESLALRQLQTRRFDTQDEKVLLSAGAAVLQDLGFNLERSEPMLGLVVASKDRTAVDAGQVAGAVIVAVLTGVVVPVDDKQQFRVAFVTRPAGSEKGGTLARITFQRTVWNSQGQVTKLEPLEDPKFYQEFFEKFSKAVFLEAHGL